MFLNQRVELLVGATASGAAVDRFTTMRGLSLSITHPKTRINHGMTRTYQHAAPDITLGFTISVTQDILEFLRTRGTQDTNGVIPTYKYALKATANNGTSKTISVSGKLDEKFYNKADGAQETAMDARCSITVTDSAEPTAT